MEPEGTSNNIEEPTSNNIEEPQTEGMDLSISTTSNVQNQSEMISDTPDIKINNQQEVPQKKKRKKSKKIKRSKEYPKFYRNAYVRYCDEVRPKYCEENPNMDSVEITKLVASKWYSLPKDEKKKFLDDAKIDKERFERELQEYKSLNPDECSPEKTPAKKKKGNNSKETKEIPKETPPPVKEPKKEKSKTNHMANQSTPKQASIPHAMPSTSSTPLPQLTPRPANIPQLSVRASTSQNNTKVNEDILKVLIGQNCEIPIFTDTFLEHNKVVESELKVLRKNNIEIEQQNSVLMKHIENMENGVIKVETEIAENRKKNMQLEVYLTKLRVILSANFNSLPIPGFKNGATVENIDKYITDLAKSSSSSTLNKARDIIKKIDLQI